MSEDLINTDLGGEGPVRIVPWTPHDLTRRLDDVVSVYGQAMGYQPELLATRRGYMASHVHRRAFCAVASLDVKGTLLGFGYGYASESGQWWHDQVKSAIPRGQRAAWLADCFEVVELHVRPAAQGHGLGAAQTSLMMDGMIINGLQLDGAVQSYLNDAGSQEMVFQTGGGSGDSPTGTPSTLRTSRLRTRPSLTR